MSRAEIEGWFPGISNDGFEETSPETENYNCFAWAGGDETEKWDPDELSGRYWPDTVERGVSVASFIQLFKVKGEYEECEKNDASLEDGIEKIALYVDSNSEVTHAARQLENGHWTSKLGNYQDISHVKLESLTNCGINSYGKVAKILKRKRQK